MLILKSLSLEPMHGFGIARRIEQISKGVFKVNPGSLMLAFQRLERGGLIDSEWRATENNRRAKYYTLTKKGRAQLEEEKRAALFCERVVLGAPVVLRRPPFGIDQSTAFQPLEREHE